MCPPAEGAGAPWGCGMRVAQQPPPLAVLLWGHKSAARRGGRALCGAEKAGALGVGPQSAGPLRKRRLRAWEVPVVRSPAGPSGARLGPVVRGVSACLDALSPWAVLAPEACAGCLIAAGGRTAGHGVPLPRTTASLLRVF